MTRLLFMGTGEIGAPAFRWLLDWSECEVIAAVTQPDKPVGRKQELQASAIKQLAVARGVPVLSRGSCVRRSRSRRSSRCEPT